MEVRVGIAIAVLIVLTGCISGAKKTARTDAQTTSRIELCTQRFVDRIKGDRGPNIRSYVKRTYCGPFARNGWVYADGTLSIKAHLSVLNGGSCKAVSTTPGGRTTTIPCDPRPLHPLECAVLHYVRRNEVRAYIRTLQRSQSVKCDDGTPLDKLGVP